MSQLTPVTPELVAQLGRYGALPLSKERLAVVAPLLDGNAFQMKESVAQQIAHQISSRSV